MSVNRTQRILSNDICDSEFLGIEDAKFGWEISVGSKKSKSQIHWSKKEHLQQ